ncbi:MAG TPA: RecX family transcriptional regulator [Candidatus Saccharimonadales bacterium]|nr:RecX family transcriptional regulator [Candidatus Saccharimonadales bacterium]
MPIVTAIKEQVKRSDRYSIYIDNKYGFSLSAQQLAESELASGQELSEAEIEDYQQASEYGKALQAAYRLLSYRPRSEREMRDRLSRKKYDEPTVDAVVTRLSEIKLLDDITFAASWVDQPKSKNRSTRRLSQELVLKGIDSDLIKETATALESEDHDRVAILALIEKKLQKNTPQDRQKLVGYLVRQGFRISLVLQILKQDFSEIHWL